MSKEQQSFEEMMKELESIVQKLDNETVSLEESENKVNQLIKEETKDEDDVEEINE